MDRISHHLPGNRINCRFPDGHSKTWLCHHSHALARQEDDMAGSIPRDASKDTRSMRLIRIVARVLNDDGSHRPVLLDGDLLNWHGEKTITAWEENIDLGRVLVT